VIKAFKADQLGNLVYSKTARNFNPMMATAADLVIAEVDEIVEVGELDPESIVTPHSYVDMIVLNDRYQKVGGEYVECFGYGGEGGGAGDGDSSWQGMYLIDYELFCRIVPN
jgi:acyl CoA:acetate/3-ketoacid CoA transferase